MRKKPITNSKRNYPFSRLNFDRKTHFLGGLHWDVLARVSSILLSTLIIIMLARGLGANGFADFQISLTVASIILWMGDFGLLTRIMNLSGGLADSELKKAWNLRLTLTTLTVLVYFGLATSITGETNSYLVVALVVDGFVDANYNHRMLEHKGKLSLWVQPLRKGFQVFLIFIIIFISVDMTGILLFYVFLIPSMILLIWDVRNVGGLSPNLDYTYLKSTFNYWFQSGSSYIGNLDYFLLNFYGYSSLIALIALPKKIINSISLIGTVTNPRNQNNVARNGKVSKHNIQLIIYATVIGLISSLFSLFFMKSLFQTLFNLDLTSNQAFLVSCVLVSTPVQMLVVGINSLFFGLEKSRYPVLASYIGSLIYILLVVLVLVINYATVMLVGVLIITRLLVELAILLYFSPQLSRNLK